MNKYINIYERERKRIKDIDKAFVIASSHVAADGTIDDLRDLHFYHMENQLNEMGV
ncbi:hypothetical protein [Lentibacillus salicampi]|uniref:hypothetical protein n=1 Tax=Lentibacillus salicampi TaxID=175306 RepID=UPI0014302CEE|nr:hypothetical protein [Lentibacillus salicampi]